MLIRISHIPTTVSCRLSLRRQQVFRSRCIASRRHSAWLSYEAIQDTVFEAVASMLRFFSALYLRKSFGTRYCGRRLSEPRRRHRCGVRHPVPVLPVGRRSPTALLRVAGSAAGAKERAFAVRRQAGMLQRSLIDAEAEQSEVVYHRVLGAGSL